jgi:[acyl-carrier-protein] S-malonyltransferase
VLDSLEFRTAQVPVILNVTAMPCSDPQVIKAKLIEQLTAPVLWYPTLRWMNQNRCDCAIELGPKKVLLGLAKSVLAEAQLLSLDTVSDLYAWPPVVTASTQ